METLTGSFRLLRGECPRRSSPVPSIRRGDLHLATVIDETRRYVERTRAKGDPIESEAALAYRTLETRGYPNAYLARRDRPTFLDDCHRCGQQTKQRENGDGRDACLSCGETEGEEAET